MTEVQMIVTTASGAVEGIWEELPEGSTVEQGAKGLGAALENPNNSIGLITDDGTVVVPYRAIEHVRILTRTA